jgi:hypothetical protein
MWVRLYGCDVTDLNARLLITSLIADGTTVALAAAERVSSALARRDPAGLPPQMRDAILRSIPRPPPNGLVALRDALTRDQRARA